jgi:cysteinyl-tRNA synthetase
MSIKPQQQVTFYNALTRKKESFKPLHRAWVGLYTCGPTVYNLTHIGNLRTYIFEDVLRRALEFKGYTVKHIMNITDVDDKIIRDASRAGKTIYDFTKQYEKKFYHDLKKLNVKPANKLPRATGHIPGMISLVEKLLKKGLAYTIEGSVYFDISKFKSYGKLSRVSSRTLKAGARIDADEYEKDSVHDFVLWKAAKPGEPSWKSPFGKGRPGWHLECSVMSMKYLGEQFDIHAGGVDLIFPHHENEIAQSEGATGKKPFVRYFIEGEHIVVNGKKMSKSLGNVFALHDLEKRNFSPLAFRYFVLTSHYRSKLNFTWKSLEAAQNSLTRLRDFIGRLQSMKKRRPLKNTSQNTSIMTSIQSDFCKAVFDDLNTPRALAVLWKLVNDYNVHPEKYDAQEVLKLLDNFDMILGLQFDKIKGQRIPKEILELAAEREKHRKQKEWVQADKIRNQLTEAGWSVEDSKQGPAIKKINV